MKKLSLEMLRLTSDEVLGRSQMKKITGGNDNVYYCQCFDSAGNTYGGEAYLVSHIDVAMAMTMDRCPAGGGCVMQ
ncbi:MAG: hypothetical protein EA341_07335 [Mongoliibacter sp.]|uniref:hypothetical protein n=1 Tax=Mongoliibacter sp. TaxID=2022438 RepID=UPI0012F3821F|nr:hypothetical protein [Mongoliibacter sp.]TVP50464.1 MAG: hypothetical protein EA341_07335 [Mongoliibacter sp.]